MRDLDRLLRGNGLYIKQAPTQLGALVFMTSILKCDDDDDDEIDVI